MAENRWFIRFRGIVEGPFTLAELHARARRGKFTRVYEVSPDGTSWSGAGKHPELFPAVGPAPRVARPLADAPAPGTATGAPPSLNEYPVAAGVPLEPVLLDPNSPGPAINPASEAKTWYYTRGAEEHGPVSLRDLQGLALAGQLGPEDFLWSDGMPDWLPAGQVQGVFPSPAVCSGSPGRGKMSPAAAVGLWTGVGVLIVAVLAGITALIVYLVKRG